MLRCPKCRRDANLRAADFPVTCVCGTRYASAKDMKRGKGRRSRVVRIPIPDHGPGTELKAIFAQLGVTDSLGCGCEALAKLMNVWGVEGCRKNRARIVKQIEKTAATKGWDETIAAGWHSLTTGLAARINPLDRFGSLVDLAIARAEERQETPAGSPLDSRASSSPPHPR